MKFKGIVSVCIAITAVSACCGNDNSSAYAAANNSEVSVFGIKDNKAEVKGKIARGSQIKVNYKKPAHIGGKVYYRIMADDHETWIEKNSICDLAAASVLEKTMYVRTPAAVLSDTLSSAIRTYVLKGEELGICGFDSIEKDGSVRRYKVRTGSGAEGYVYGKYLTLTREEALALSDSSAYYTVYGKVRNPFRGGKADGCDFYPCPKTSFKDNVMPEKCCAIYLNSAPYSFIHLDEYIETVKGSNINAFVIDIKDDQAPGFKAEAMRKYSPTNYRRAGAEKEAMYIAAVKKLHEQGFYVIGRITCFKDTYYVKDHPDDAITDLNSGGPLYHNKANWPSAYDRKMWEYNVELAKEAVLKFGFDEINFDYVRFPDRMNSIENHIDLHNTYNESKVQAIQRFLCYACDEIHSVGAYVSADVFGESANPEYTTAYGQYWPAISNVVDAICGMPYPDHFAAGAYGIDKPWNNPYKLLYNWGRRAYRQQSVTPTPAKVRTWIQITHVMKHVDRNGIDYDASNILKEISALKDADIYDGYMTWIGSSSLDRYKFVAPAFF